MPKTYLNAPTEVLNLLEEVKNTPPHQRLAHAGVKIGVIMAYAAVNEETGERKGYAITGYAKAPAAAQIKIVSPKDRLVKGYDVELLIDGDNWPETPENTKRALLDHELTHIKLTDRLDDLERPKLKLRQEDFIVWGFLEVVQRWGRDAIEARSVQNLIATHGSLLLGQGDTNAEVRGSLHKLAKTLKDANATITPSGGKKPKPAAPGDDGDDDAPSDTYPEDEEE